MTIETICSRCGEARWPAGQPTEPYICQRCREVLAGGNAVDPCPSDAQRTAWAAAAVRLKDFRWSQPTEPVRAVQSSLPVGEPSSPPEVPRMAEIPQSEEPTDEGPRTGKSQEVSS